MKTLEEMIELYKKIVACNNNVPKMDKVDENILVLLLELKQRREQDLTLEMVEFMQYMSNGSDCSFKNSNGQHFHCPEVGSCDEACTRTRLWLQEQEARLRED